MTNYQTESHEFLDLSAKADLFSNSKAAWKVVAVDQWAEVIARA